MWKFAKDWLQHQVSDCQQNLVGFRFGRQQQFGRLKFTLPVGTSEETMTRTIANVVPQDEHLLAGERNAGLTHSGLTWSEAPALVEASAVVHEPMKTAQHNPDEIPQLMNAVIAMSGVKL